VFLCALCINWLTYLSSSVWHSCMSYVKVQSCILCELMYCFARVCVTRLQVLFCTCVCVTRLQVLFCTCVCDKATGIILHVCLHMCVWQGYRYYFAYMCVTRLQVLFRMCVWQATGMASVWRVQTTTKSCWRWMHAANMIEVDLSTTWKKQYLRWQHWRYQLFCEIWFNHTVLTVLVHSIAL